MGKMDLSAARLAAAIVLTASSGAAVAQAPPAQTAWVMGRAAENCYLTRSFGSGSQKIDVLIQAFGSSSPYHVVIRSNGLPLRPQRAEVARIGFGGSLAPTDTFVIVGKSGEMPTAVFAASSHAVSLYGSIYLYQKTDARIVVPLDPAGQVLSIDMTDAAPLSLQLGDMTGEYARLDECARGLEAKWVGTAGGGVTPVSGPELLHPGEASWHMKYPENLLLSLTSGIAEMRMTVDEKGRARDCVVQMSTWASRFGEDSCAAMERVARFEPAKDANGNSVKALFRASALFINYKW